MRGREIKEKLKAGGRVFGTFLSPNSSSAALLPDRGLDFVIASTEHCAYGYSDFLPLSLALRSKGIACLVRTYNREPDNVAKAADSFPDGVVVPYVEDDEELKQLIGAAKYRPLKGEALDKVLADGPFPSEKTRAYIEKKCEDTIFVAMVESMRGVENLDAICSVRGLDAILVGPNDLTVAMGIPEERDNPEYIAVIKRIIDTAARHGIAVGAQDYNIAHVKRLVAQGGRFISYGSDARLVQSGILTYLKEVGAT